MTKEFYNAVYYERVSTLHEDQTNSLENQRKLRESYLKRHPEVHLVGVYSERISGKSDLRPQYNEMVKRIEQGDIDYILVKDLKRLSRSLEVSAQLRNMVKKYQCKLILLATGEIYDPNADDKRMLFGFESLVNEEVVFRQSEYGRIAHRQKMEAKRLNRNNCTFGYFWDNEKRDIVIDQDQAEVVRSIFDMYVFQNKGIGDIREYLSSLGIFRSAVTVNKWLQETAYIGIFCMNKKGSELGVGMGQKTRRFTNPKDEWILVERPELAILSKDVFELAQSIRNSRQRIYNSDKNGMSQGRFRGFHLFSSKIFCEECGYPYVHGWADRACTVAVYRDSSRHRKANALERCTNIQFNRVYESDIKQITLLAINGLITENRGCFDMLLKVLEKVMRDDNSIEVALKSLNRQLADIDKKSDKVKSAYLEAPSGPLRAALIEDYEKLASQKSEVEARIKTVQEERSSETVIEKRIKAIQSVMKQLEIMNDLDRKTVEQFIYKILINRNGEVQVVLNSNITQSYTITDRKRSSKSSAFDVTKRVQYYYSEASYEKVVKMLIPATMARSQPDMQTAPKICSQDWKRWF